MTIPRGPRHHHGTPRTVVGSGMSPKAVPQHHLNRTNLHVDGPDHILAVPERVEKCPFGLPIEAGNPAGKNVPPFNSVRRMQQCAN